MLKFGQTTSLSLLLARWLQVAGLYFPSTVVLQSHALTIATAASVTKRRPPEFEPERTAGTRGDGNIPLSGGGSPEAERPADVRGCKTLIKFLASGGETFSFAAS
jgi:hypothetical protein